MNYLSLSSICSGLLAAGMTLIATTSIATAATPLPSLAELGQPDDSSHSWLAARQRLERGTSTNIADSQTEAPQLATQPEPTRWRVGAQYFQGTANNLGELLSGDFDTVSQNGVRITVARMLASDLWDWPLDCLAEGGMMWHNEQGAQSDLFQWTLALKFEWKRWPWSDHLRTRLGFSTGLSYAEHIPWAEQVNRGTDSSKHLLHYLELSLAMNCADLTRITCLDRVLPGSGANALERFWLVAGIPHRSGAWGLYGEDRNGRSIQSGSNYLSIGLEADF